MISLYVLQQNGAPTVPPHVFPIMHTEPTPLAVVEWAVETYRPRGSVRRGLYESAANCRPNVPTTIFLRVYDSPEDEAL
jgi:hypothetical protein